MTYKPLSLPIDDLVKECREQTALYIRREDHETGPCLRLWQMAVVAQNQEAWAAIIEQYQPFVRKWVQQRTNTSAWLQAEEDALLNGVFINLYRFLTPDKFDTFSGLPALMQYLKMCCWTVVADAQRDRQARLLEISLNAPSNSGDPANSTSDTGDFTLADRLGDPLNLEEVLLDKLDRADFWKMVWEKLDEPLDRQLIYLRYVQNMPPREITQLYPQLFPTVQDVYKRIKNLLWRLRNSGIWPD